MTFRLAHLSDPHVGPLGRVRLHQLIGKRATGYANWRRGRSRSHDMTVLETLVADLKQQGAAHVACTGDLCNIGLPSEWETARTFLEALGSPETVSFVPGNHDAYVRGSLEGLLAACSGYTGDDSGSSGRFPYLRRRGPVALVGLSSAIPTKPFVATGRLGPPQLAAAESLLRALATEPGKPFRVVMIHHPPQPGGASSGRELKDAAAFTAMIARAGAELILHGHNHTTTSALVPGPDGRFVPVIGAPSASARPDGHGGLAARRASYLLYEITRNGAGYAVTARRRGLDAGGTVCDLGPIALD
ncbi:MULTISPECIES: metallophosphoesterase family protein [Methylobacterium]|uniref:3',5'-cyclic AMP phosphodiesterase CpdA n=1 Tax=Methylobacterium brachiatum TaxID=269660 RepID=A0AAJ1TUQ3_9HYPH|nr:MULTISPECIES: metallophosphoesterase [Methylobacterium]AYO81204.1 metallophosphoesterase [Methylobacterium brachiatum]EIZ86244.1 metallophosphoesterase [Methylobacterium sp. GXF4]MCB4803880.1 metallophosphoesterase [Methylobacterium brachiatum]MDF2600743.1 metallophosphoesterase [Methylobacterium brachiatum]MDH2311015.1 metallophosphoesterase [Methylobacterium brachiatum]